MYSYGPLHMAEQKQDDQLEHTYSSYVRIRDVALKTCRRRWMIGRSGERGSGISVLAARHDDDDDDDILYVHIFVQQNFIITWIRKKIFLNQFKIIKLNQRTTQREGIRVKQHIGRGLLGRYQDTTSRSSQAQEATIGTIYQPLRSGRIWHKVNF